MTRIEKSPAVYAYTCDVCQCEYDSDVKANDCEKSHMTTNKIIELTYLSSSSIYPDAIKIRMSDNNVKLYKLNSSLPENILQDVTNNDGSVNLAIVNGYIVTVKKEYTQDDETIVEELSGVNVELKDETLYVNIPDDIQLTTDMNVCVKVTDVDGNEITKESENSPFKEMIITGEVTQTLSNECNE